MLPLPAARILLALDRSEAWRDIARIAAGYGEVVVTASVTSARRAVAAADRWDAVLIDAGLRDGDGLEWLRDVRGSLTGTPLMVLTDSLVTAETGLAAMLRAECVLKPVRPERIVRFLNGACHTASSSERPLPPGPPFEGSDAFEGCVTYLRELLRRPVDASHRYRLGEAVAYLKAHAASFGAGAVAMLAARLGQDMQGLYRHAVVAERWSGEEVQRWIDDGVIRWSHLVTIAAVDDEHERARLLECVRRHGLSVRELGDLVQARAPRVRHLAGAGPKRTPSGIRPSVSAKDGGRHPECDVSLDVPASSSGTRR